MVELSQIVIAVGVILAVQLTGSQARYLPTRNYGDNIEKLRELMFQILESSNENSQQPIQSSSQASQLMQQPDMSPRVSLQRADRGGMPWTRAKYVDSLDSSLVSSSPARNDRLSRPNNLNNNNNNNTGYDSNARLNFLLKHPQRFMNNLDQLM